MSRGGAPGSTHINSACLAGSRLTGSPAHPCSAVKNQGSGGGGRGGPPRAAGPTGEHYTPRGKKDEQRGPVPPRGTTRGGIPLPRKKTTKNSPPLGPTPHVLEAARPVRAIEGRQ